MATSEPCEITEPETGREGLCTGETYERSSGDTDKTNSTSDTLELARLDRESQGSWEFEYSYGGEADLHLHYDSCEKNPGHKKFIPVDKFTIEDLSEDYRDEDLIDYIRLESDLTVRVTVKCVSDKRPANVPGSGNPYPGYDKRGQQRMTVGTGRVDYVDVDNDRIVGPCKCKECRNSCTPEMHFAIIHLVTAAHVVFDALEGEHTMCHLFFDREGTPETCSGVITLTGMSCMRTCVTEDTCFMYHYTHDLDLARRLDQTRKQVFDQCEKVCTKMQQICNFKQRLGAQDRQPLLFIVSHPHGCSKQVSIGHFTSAHMFVNSTVSFMYSTATCPGSSGAHVVALPGSAVTGFNTNFTHLNGIHRGVSGGENYCGTYRDVGTPILVTLGILKLNKGSWEDNFCSVEEGDENQHYAACQKNPGHGNFFPVDKFSLDNLPPLYRSDDLMEFIKRMSALTVRVTVNYVSDKRPETVPGTDIPYPWSSNKDSRMTRVGTGFIRQVLIFDAEYCPCKECRNSAQPKPTYASIEIRTASHLVYDELEAEHTTCQLFFDSGEKPDVCKNAITLTDINKFHKSHSVDICTIWYFTHNMDFVHSLCDILMQHCRVYESLKEKDSVAENGGDTAKQDPPLHIVVSHPHGCAKQVSVGCCGSPDGANANGSQSSYSSIVCPGSSGAPLILTFLRPIYPFCKDFSFN